MKLATTTGDFARYHPNDEERLRELHRAGFRYADLDMYTFTPDCPYTKEGWEERVLSLKSLARELGVTFVQAHSQGGNPLSEDEGHVNFIVAATLRSLEICAMLGIPSTVVHSGYAKGISKEESFRRNRDFYLRLLPTAERYGVNILIENSTSANMRDMYFTNSAKDMLEFLEFVNHPRLHACWDTGHANCEGAQYEEILTLGKELYAIHYNDNRGAMDEHLIPYLGTLNHDEVLHALMDADFKGPFTLECSSSLIPQNYWLGSRRPYPTDERLVRPPLFMQQDLEALLYKTARHLLTAYGLFEE